MSSLFPGYHKFSLHIGSVHPHGSYPHFNPEITPMHCPVKEFRVRNSQHSEHNFYLKPCDHWGGCSLTLTTTAEGDQELEVLLFLTASQRWWSPQTFITTVGGLLPFLQLTHCLGHEGNLHLMGPNSSILELSTRAWGSVPSTHQCRSLWKVNFRHGGGNPLNQETKCIYLLMKGNQKYFVKARSF